MKDAHRHGVKMLPVAVDQSVWKCTVVSDDVVRLGFCVVNGLRQEHTEQLVRERECTAFQSIEDLKSRTQLTKEEMRTLAELGALNCFSKDRRAAMWRVEEPTYHDLLTNACHFTRDDKRKSSPLSPMTMPERVKADYDTMNLTTGPHPMKLLRESLPDIWRARDLVHARHGAIVRIAGNVICRQRPGTAKGFVFISLEDETGVSNAIVAPDVFERLRLLITEEPFLMIEGEVQNSEGVVLIKTQEIKPLAHAELAGAASHDFH
jgi:error-prone DNA polymerase